MNDKEPKYVFTPRINVLVVEQYIDDFLDRIVGVDAAIFTDEALLSMYHPFDGMESYGELLESGAPTVPPEKFVPYSTWVSEIRRKTEEVYGVKFEKHDPYLWEIGYLMSGLTKKL